MKKSITIKDIAKRLNVSVATVSRALRDSSEIKKETKLAVLQMAKELDYHPNLLASSLSSKKSKILGVVVPTINRQFWSNSISGIESIAFEEGYKVMIFQSSEMYNKEVEIVETLANSMVDGILLAFSKETQNYEHVEHIISRGIPIVLFERVCNELNVSKVVTNDYYGAKTIVEHLIKKGRKKVAYIGGPLSLTVCKDRFLGYKDALNNLGLPFYKELVIEIPLFTSENAGEALKLLWESNNRPDALFCFADIFAVGALVASRELGIKVPESLAIAGFGNDDTGKFIIPAITTMAQPSFQIGELAAQLIFEEIKALNDDRQFIFKTKIIDPTLIERESG